MSLSLLKAIYDRYCDDSDLQDFISYSSSSSSSTSASCSSSSSTSPVTSDSNNNSDISFYIPQTYSPFKAENTNIKTSISIILNNIGISHIGDIKELESVCKNVLELDLSKNEIDDWNEIKKLLSSLKKLRLLNLSSNKLNAKPSDYFNQVWPAEHNFTLLNTLILNSCFLDLNLIEILLDRLANLNELHLSSNNYSSVNFSKDFHKKSLKILYFNNNSLSKWHDVCKLGKSFPNLEHLVLSENNLENFSIIFEETEDQLKIKKNSEIFKNLKILILNKLKINDWSTIDQLREFPMLKHVRIQNVPLLEGLTNDEKYYILAGHLDASIESLNGSKMSKDEKENCERKYIRYFMDSSFKPNRYFELEAKHGKLDRLAEVKMDIRKRVQVKIKFNEKLIYEKIDVRQTVGEFKKYLEKFVGHPSNRFKLFYIDTEACSMSIYGPEELKHTNRCLYSFNVRDDDEFEIDLKPTPVLHATASEYQFQYQHLHHLHHHHFNSHLNNNSHYQVPLSSNSSCQSSKLRNRKAQAEVTSSISANSNSNSKPGSVTSPKMINKSKYMSKFSCRGHGQGDDSNCSASMPADLHKLDDERESLPCKHDVGLVVFSNEDDQ